MKAKKTFIVSLLFMLVTAIVAICDGGLVFWTIN